MSEIIIRPLEFCLLMMGNIAIGALGFIPSLLITPINIDRFGLAGGSVLSVSGEILGALAGFWVYRSGAKHIPPAWLEHWGVRFFRRQNRRTVFWAVLVLRLVPFVPSGVVTAGAALTRISMPAFFLASSVGKLPAVALEIAVAFGMTLVLPRNLLYGLVGSAALVLAFAVRLRKRRMSEISK